MKRMTGIKLVNWHYFVNETIRLQGSTLVTGDNGSGKSTIFDAIQMVLIADQRKVRFNVSAHDETNRDLKGYLRCRTGRDDPDQQASQGYLRSGDFTSYVALEFLDTGRGEHVVLGMVVDTFGGEPDAPQFFRYTGRLDDTLFLDGDRPRSAAELKVALRSRRGGEVFGTNAAFRTALLAQLGHLNDRFFTLLIKGLAFHPITRIRDFVYEYLLDPREIKVDAMLENFRQYRQYDQLVQQTKEKLARLDRIAQLYAERVELERTAGIQEYVVLRASREVADLEVQNLQSKHTDATERQAAIKAEQERLTTEISKLDEELRALHDARARNKAYEALAAIDRRITELSRDLSRLEREGRQLAADARTELQALREAVRIAEEHASALALTDPEPLGTLTAAGERLVRLASGDLAAPPASLDDLMKALEALGDQTVTRIGGLTAEQKSLSQEKSDLEESLQDLRKRGRVRYPKAVDALRSGLAEALPDTSAEVLCDLIDIPSEKWHNAVEGYLNSQRFDLFVPADRFNAALHLYELTKHERKIESAGLVNSEALIRSRPKAEPGSLAEEVTTDHPAARAYIDRLLGRVMKSETEQELKRHAVAITPTCMTYRNHTARQIEFHVYQTLYVGARAVTRQIATKEQRLIQVEERLAALAQELSVCNRFLSLLRGRSPGRIAERWQPLTELPTLYAEIEAKKAERAQIDVGELNALQQQIDLKGSTLRDMREGALKLATAGGEVAKELQALTESLAGAQRTWQQRNDELETYVHAHPELAEIGAARFMEAMRSRHPSVIEVNFAGNRKGILTEISNRQKELLHARLDYNSRYQFGGAPDSPDNSTYEQERQKLAGSELPAYEEKIAQARTAAEEEFKQHFIYKLQENIRLARQEFDSLNKVLKDIPFGQDRYQFVCAADRSNRHFYDMIMDEFAMEGFNLFSEAFRERYGETLDELFRLILDVPEERQAENIKRYTDYRTYLEFDIKIHHATGETSTFSKVAREKSGGETQTPFYVAMIASFLQLYRPKQNPHSLRLLMFDEAFNRMDPDRAENTLQFIRRLGLQVLAAAPTDKCEIIAPHMETTLLVLRDGHSAWLEDYHQVLAARPETAEAEAASTAEVTE